LLQEAKSNLLNKGFLDLKIPHGIDLIAEIERLKKEKNVILLAHFYQSGEIQDIADFIGDSLALAQKAEQTNASMILFAGVHFMGETAKILNPSKKVLLPDLNAGCSLADSCIPSDLATFKELHPDHIVISYVNCTAEVKALSDIICTSSNALKVINSVPKEQKIIFAPDKNLGRYLVKETGRDMLLWDGACIIHQAFSIEKLIDLSQQYPEAEIIAHPESEDHILKVAHYIGSTTQLLNYAKESPCTELIVATEVGILHQMSKDNPKKSLIPAPSSEDNTCSCSECHFMKLNNLEKIYLALEYELPEILMEEELRLKALKPLKRMLELS
jgi:quinolinate synthase